MEAGKLWSDLVERHHAARAANTPWPSKAQFQKELKGQYPALHSQSIQQVIGDFCEAVDSARQLRKKGHEEAKYPWRKPKFHSVIYTNQGARIRDGCLILPNGVAGNLRVRIPEGITLPGRLMEVRLHYGTVEIVCHVPDVARTIGPTIGVDLGVNTLIAATDGNKAVLVSGRAAKASVQWRNKQLASIVSAQSKKQKGSRRHKKLQRRKYRVLGKARNRINDLCHKATRKIADAFPDAKAYVGEPFNDAARKMGRKQAQQVSQACNARLIQLLDYKLAGAIQVSEAYSSQTCPVCGERSKHRRVYRCKCGTVAPRDVVGCLNILSIGTTGSLQRGCRVPNAVHWIYPSKYPVATRVVRADTTQIARAVRREAAAL